MESSDVVRSGTASHAGAFDADGDWRSLLHAIPQIVWISGPDGRVRFLNARWTEYTGLAITSDDRDALVSRAVHPADLSVLHAEAARHRPHGTPYSFEYRLRTRDGTYRWHLARVVPTRGPDGTVTSWVGTGTDIHDQKNATFALREANRRLAAQGERLGAALLAGATGLFRWDIASDTIELDETLERLFGLPHAVRHASDDVLARMAERDRARIRASADEAVSSGSLEEEFAVQSPEGVRYVEVRGRIAHDEAQGTRYMIGAAMDVTSRRITEAALRERDAEFRMLADSIPQLAWMTDATGYIHWYNQRWYDYTGTTIESMRGWGWQACHHPEHVHRVTENFRAAIARGESWEDTFPLRGADGEYRWFLSRALPIRDGDGRVLKWFGTNTDITPQLHASEERERLLSAERRARAEAERANRAKSEFLAVMSHELRTPLNAIGGYADLMLAGVPEPALPAHAGYLERIQRSQKHLLGLINAVLNFARLEAGRVDYRTEHVQVREFLGSVESMVLPQVRARRLDFRSDAGAGDLAILADADKTLQILLNLISNAVKFTPPGGSLSVTARRVQPGRIAIDVTDTGHGIPPDRTTVIFDPFVQVDSRLTRESQGAGLGLAISRDLARGMAGDLTVVSEPGRGSTFTLTLPEAPPTEL